MGEGGATETLTGEAEAVPGEAEAAWEVEAGEAEVTIQTFKCFRKFWIGKY